MFGLSRSDSSGLKFRICIDYQERVKDKIKEGNNEKEIYQFLSEKFGDWILLNPPFKKNSYLLWFLPYLLLTLGIILLFFFLNQRIKPSEYKHCKKDNKFFEKFNFITEKRYF